jgi:hypothetical protein
MLDVVAGEVFRPENVRQGLLALELERREERDGARGALEHMDAEINKIHTELERYQAAVAQGVDPGAMAEPINKAYAQIRELESQRAGLEASTVGDSASARSWSRM